MKMRKPEHFVRSSSSVSAQKFSVRMTDKLFETLYATLYKFKEAAVVRELWSNANDAHQMRNRMHKYIPSYVQSCLVPPQQRFSRFLAPADKKVTIHLPDDYEPWLEIRDWGVGLSLEQIIGHPIEAKEDEVLIEGNIIVKEDEIPDGSAVIGEPSYYGDELVFRDQSGEIIRRPGMYTTLFDSTKEEDNGQIGSFGLGSKSPFSVSDSFTVESRYEGKLYRFVMFLDENKLPSVDLVTKDMVTRDPAPEDTDEFNGLTVRVPVKNSRFRAFADEITRLGRVMDPAQRPVIENDAYFYGWQEISRDQKVNNTYIQKNGNQGHYAVMGGVSYPVDLGQVREDLRAVMEKFPSTYTFFEIGDLNVPPSREDLSYDQFTRESIEREYSIVTKKVLEDKARELREATARGSLFFFMARQEITDYYGKHFRSMLDQEFPNDERLHGQFGSLKTDIHPEIVPLTGDAWYRKTDAFRIELHSRGQLTRTDIRAADMISWTTGKRKLCIVFVDGIRCRTMKIETAVRKYDDVLVVEIGENMLTRRNTSRTDTFSSDYKNAEELKAFFHKWVGDEETTVDRLAFADAFMEYVDGLIDGEVFFLSEMPYEKVVVDKNPGLYEMKTWYGISMRKDDELSKDEVNDIIESGKKVAYVEMSGYDIIHKFNGMTCSEKKLLDAVKFIENIYFTNDEGKNVSYLEHMGFHARVLLARRKSLPLMKNNPKVFVPVDEIMQEIYAFYRETFEKNRAVVHLKDYRRLYSFEGRMRYVDYLLSASGVHSVEINKLKDNFFNKVNEIETLLEADDGQVQKISKMENTPGLKIRPDCEFRSLDKILNLFTGLYYVKRENKLLENFIDNVNGMRDIVRDISEEMKGLGFHGFADAQFSDRQKLRNRKMVERYRLVEHIKQTYEWSMHNPVESENIHKEDIIKTLLGL